MKNYNFEHSRVAESGEEVELRRKGRGFRLGSKLLCLLLAFVIWLIVTNVNQQSEEMPDGRDAFGQSENLD